MSVMISDDKKELIVTCKAGDDDAIHIIVDDTDKEYDTYAYLNCLSGNWYRDQEDTIFKGVSRKIKKIWAILRNKDFYYSEILMSYEDFQKFKDYINQF